MYAQTLQVAHMAQAQVSGLTPQNWAVIASVGAGIATSVGSILVFWIKELSGRVTALLMATAAGVMLSASFYSLLIPAWTMASSAASNTSPGAPLLTVLAGVASGIAVLALADKFVPQEALREGEAHEGPYFGKRKALLLVFAMALHNLPEGLAVGVSFSAPKAADGFLITSGVMIQDLPEGLLTALALMAAHYHRTQTFWIVALTGVIEAFGGLLGIFAVSMVHGLVPITLAFSAGAMLYVVVMELMPESLRTGYRFQAVASGLMGFIVTAWLDRLLT